MRRLLESVLDNPILIKHMRSRLRVGQAMPLAAIVLVLSACLAWAGNDPAWLGSASAVILLVGMQILILALIGASQINASLGGARESGILAFHRVSPLPPSVVALGFFLGAPIREYLLAAIPIPFAVFTACHIDWMIPSHGLFWLEQLEAALLLTTWVVHALVMLGCLSRKKPRGSLQGTIVALVLLLIFGTYGAAAFYFGAQWLLERELRLNFFGMMVPWVTWILVYALAAIGFLGLAAARKMRAERAHAYSKPQALACMATLTILVLGGLWKVARLLPGDFNHDPTTPDVIMLAVVYLLALAAILLSATITPSSGEYIKGVRRALRAGRRRPSFWSEAGTNQVAVFALAALVLIGASAVVQVVGRPPLNKETDQWFWVNSGRPVPEPLFDDAAWLASRQAILSRPIVVAVLTVAYVGFAHQYFALRTRGSGMALLTLFLFVTWLVPPLVGALIGMSATPNEGLALTIFALSPLPGIALSSGLGQTTDTAPVQLAALAPAITFAFVFKYLLVLTQRKIDRALREADKAPKLVAPLEIAELV